MCLKQRCFDSNCLIIPEEVTILYLEANYKNKSIVCRIIQKVSETALLKKCISDQDIMNFQFHRNNGRTQRTW